MVIAFLFRRIALSYFCDNVIEIISLGGDLMAVGITMRPWMEITTWEREHLRKRLGT